MIEQAPQVYPVLARSRNLEGTVILDADIDETGKAVDVKIVKSAGFGFDEAAIEHIKKSRYSPGQVGTKPVSVRMRFTVTFSLTD